METRVLIVDDEASIVEGLTMLLEMEAIHTAGAFDRKSAVEMLAETFYPVIVADLCLRTTKDGLRLLDEIRRRSPRSRVVTITGFATPELEKEVRRRGVSLILHKPMTGESILAAIRDVIAEIEQEAAVDPERDIVHLYESIQRVLFSIPRRRYGFSQEMAEDVVHQAWVLYLEKRGDVRDPRRWLAGTTANLCLQEIDRRSRMIEGDADDDLHELPDEAPNDPADVVAVRVALGRLDERSRDLCEWIGLEGFSYEDVSNATAMPAGSIGPLYIRAKKKLRAALLN